MHQPLSAAPLGAAPSRRFRVGPWVADPLRHALQPAQGPSTAEVTLEPKVMQVLVALARRAGQPVRKATFMDEVWGDTVVTDDVLARCISELRKTLGDDPRAPTYIETIRKVGYRLIARVTWLDRDALASGASGVASPADTTPSRSSSVLRGWRLPAALTAAALLGATLVLGWSLAREAPAPPPVRQTLPLTSFPGLETDPALSPDRAQVVFAWDEGDTDARALYLRQPGADTPLRLTSAPAAHDHSPTWSPDGRFVAFARRAADGSHSVRVVSSIGGNDRVVLDAGARPVHDLAWSPDTSRAALAVTMAPTPHASPALFLLPLDADADSLEQLTRPPVTGPGDRFLAFDPSGRRLAFARGIADTRQDVAVLDLATEVMRRVTTDSSRVTGLTWEANGTHLLVASDRSGASALWRVDAASGTAMHVLDASEGAVLTDPTVDASGTHLAYAERARNVNVWTASPGGAAVPLLTSTRYDGAPSYAPDGARVAFVSERAGPPNLWLHPADRTPPVQLTDLASSEAAQPRWSPDGTTLAFAARVNGNLDVYLVGAEGGPPLRLTTDPADDDAPAWSPDGRSLYFASTRSGQWEIYRTPVAADTLAPTLVPTGGARAARPLGEDALLLVRTDTAGLWMQPLHGDLGSFIPVALEAPRAAPPPDSVRAELVVPYLAPADYANWASTERGLYYVAREGGRPYLHRLRRDGASERLALLDDLAPGPQLSANADGRRVAYGRVDRDESDVLLVEHYRAAEGPPADR